MKNLLVDTQILIWIQTDSDRLSNSARELLINPFVSKWVSEVSLLEIAIKKRIKKLNDFKLSISEYTEQVQADGFKLAPIHNKHINQYELLPLFDEHRDPFDRLILATALHENWAVLSADPKFTLYKEFIDIVW